MLTADDFATLKQQLIAHEGMTTYLYDDATGERITKGSIVRGHPTWGVGFNCDAVGFMAEAIDAQLDAVLTARVNEVLSALPWAANLPSGPFRAIVDIAYNAGVDGLLEFHKMLSAAQLGNYRVAASEIIDSALAPARKQRLASLMIAA